jgi:hypothetical protein
MYIEARKKKSGETYYTFSYDKGGKRVRLKTSEHPYFTDLTKAREWADSQDAIRAAEKAYHQKKLSWKNQYYDFATLLQDYLKLATVQFFSTTLVLLTPHLISIYLVVVQRLNG